MLIELSDSWVFLSRNRTYKGEEVVEVAMWFNEEELECVQCVSRHVHLVFSISGKEDQRTLCVTGKEATSSFVTACDMSCQYNFITLASFAIRLTSPTYEPPTTTTFLKAVAMLSTLQVVIVVMVGVRRVQVGRICAERDESSRLVTSIRVL